MYRKLHKQYCINALHITPQNVLFFIQYIQCERICLPREICTGWLAPVKNCIWLGYSSLQTVAVFPYISAKTWGLSTGTKRLLWKWLDVWRETSHLSWDLREIIIYGKNYDIN